ncbi:hypothetical protein LCGC14_2835520 [marine sediment metagenome]|uniref:10 kDa chaperonin n=1 Tax=marine sediment metagenome TaxID=412755 RepID=A0A0F9B3T6_9ZZZZ
MAKTPKLEEFNIIGDNILLTPIKESKKAGGFIIPDQSEDKPEMGIVVKTSENKQYKKGDIVLFNRYITTEFYFQGTNYLILKVDDVIGYYRK